MPLRNLFVTNRTIDNGGGDDERQREEEKEGGGKEDEKEEGEGGETEASTKGSKTNGYARENEGARSRGKEDGREMQW